MLRLYKDIFVKGKYNQFWRQASLWRSITVWKPLKCVVKNSRNRKSFLRCKRNLFYLNITVADFVLLVLVGSSSLPKLLTGTYKCWSTFKTIGRHLELSADSYKSNSVSFELHNCQPIVTTVSQVSIDSFKCWSIVKKSIIIIIIVITLFFMEFHITSAI